MLAAACAAALPPAAPALAGGPPRPDASSTAAGAPAAGATATAAETQAPAGAELAAGIACRSVYAWRNYTTWWGYQLWRYNLQVDYCWNGSSVIAISRYRWVDCCGPGWSFEGHVSATFEPAGRWSVRSFTQGKFSFVLGTNNQYPWVQITVYGNGGYSWATG